MTGAELAKELVTTARTVMSKQAVYLEAVLGLSKSSIVWGFLFSKSLAGVSPVVLWGVAW